MSLVIAHEPFSRWRHEAPVLFEAHWREVGLYQDEVPLDPDYDKFIQLEHAGVLEAFTVRVRMEDGSHGKLAGYAGYLVIPHLHYRTTLVAANDVIYLDPAFRHGLTAARLVKFAEAYLATARGARRFTYHVKTAHDFGPLLLRAGYAHEENIFGKLV